MAKVCVCIPTRNRYQYVKEALHSVLNQTFSDFRIIVSDDASEPQTAAAVEAYVRELNDYRIAYCYHQANLKEFSHGRFLFGQCSEEFFTMLHDDDIWLPSFLEHTITPLLRDETLACVTANQYIIDQDGKRQVEMTKKYWRRMGRERYPEGRLHILEPFLTYGFFTLSSTVFRTSVLRHVSLVDPEYEGNFNFDINLFLRLGEKTAVAYYLPEPLAAYRIHPMTISATWATGFNARVVETFMNMFEKRSFSGKAEQQRKRQLASAYHNYAIVSYFKKDLGAMYRYLGKCIHKNLWSWKNWVYCFFILFLPFLIKPVFKDKVIL
jgi:glycosyltransferase involved in cell wall biosynthesis